MEVLPIDTLEDLLSWTFPEKLRIPLSALKNLQPRSKSVCLETGKTPDKPFKTLVCSDLANGYHQDR